MTIRKGYLIFTQKEITAYLNYLEKRDKDKAHK